MHALVWRDRCHLINIVFAMQSLQSLRGSCNYVVFENFTRAFWNKLAFEFMLLPILKFV